jgi:hypothetical protein
MKAGLWLLPDRIAKKSSKERTKKKMYLFVSLGLLLSRHDQHDA